jgi:hypothetical protein
VIRFLRLFHQFRTLEAIEHDEVELANVRRTVTELQHENDKLQDRLDASMEDRGRLWGSLQTSLASERAAYQLNINAASQRMNGGIPFPDAPHLAQQAAPEPGESTSLGRQSRISISDRLNSATSQYLNSKLARS